MSLSPAGCLLAGTCPRLAGTRTRRRLARSARFGSLPRPVGLAFAATWWSTQLTFVWLTVRIFPHGGFPVWDAQATAGGQQLAFAAWTMHFIAWCGIACRRLNRNRAASGT